MYIINKIEANYKNKKAQNNYIEKVINQTKLKARRVEIEDKLSNDVWLKIDGVAYTLTHEKIERPKIFVDEKGNSKLQLGYLLRKDHYSENEDLTIYEGSAMMVWRP